MKKLFATLLFFFTALQAFAEQPSPLQDNGFIAAYGLVAPKEVTDSYAWALDLLQKGRADAADKVVGKLADVNSVKAIPCITEKRWANWVHDADCIYKPDIVALKAANQLMLERYDHLLEYKNFKQVTSVIMFGRNLINLQSLYLASLVEQKKANPDAAIQSWIKNARFYKMTLADDSNLIMRSILMINYNMVLRVLPELLYDKPDLAKKYSKQLQEILSPFGPAQMRLEAIMKMEEAVIMPGIKVYGLEKEWSPKFKAYSDDFITFSKIPPAQAIGMVDNFFDKYDAKKKYKVDKIPDNIEKMGKEMQADFVISAVGTELIMGMHSIDARNRMLNLYVGALVEDVTPNTAASYYESAPTTLYDPYTAKPFIYDAAAHTLSFTDTLKHSLMVQL